jgi:broad specificity phosphatase PhoE
VIFESHATSCDNEKGIASGHNDSPLSPTGVLQAKQLGERYADERIEAIFCSDLSRSRETAKIAFMMRDVPIIEDSRLREWDYGRFNGHAVSEVEPMKSLYLHDAFPGGESLASAIARIERFLDEVSPLYFEKTILLIGHRATFYTLEHRYCQRPLQDLVEKPWRWQPGWRYSRKP